MSCCTLYREGGARTVPDRMWAVARYYDISSKPDRGDIFIVHDQKSSYRKPLVGTKLCRTVELKGQSSLESWSNILA